jgi:endoglucanase
VRRPKIVIVAAATAATLAAGWLSVSLPGAIADPVAQVAAVPEDSPATTAPATTAPATAAPATAAPAAAAPAGSPVARNGQLHVCGVKLCNERDEVIQLRGMSSHGLQFFPDCVNERSLAALRTDWNADLIRLSMYVQEGGLETDPAGFTAKVNGLVDQAVAQGLYVIVDFHILTPGDPNANLALAQPFFADIAARHADEPNIIYEVANEPNGVSWDAIKGYAEKVIPVIRAADPDGVVLVGTRGFSSLGVSEGSDETEVINDPVNAENVMYTFHFYAASHKDLQRETVARAARSLPLFVSEFGTQTFTGDGANDLASATTWLDLLKSLSISYAMWSFSDGAESNSAFVRGTCAGADFAGPDVLTESGRFIRDRIIAANGPAAATG